MDLHVKKVVYFETAGAQNTKTLLEVVKDYVNKENIGSILIATTTGKTGAEATKAFKGRNVIVVTQLLWIFSAWKI
ncbi:MAG: hypothetical protein QXX34_07305 [Candidatus Bathyarchaeia archaeon]